MSIGLWLFLWIVAGGALMFGLLSRSGAAASAPAARSTAQMTSLSGASAAPSVTSLMSVGASTAPAAQPIPEAIPTLAPDVDRVSDNYRPELLAGPRYGKGDDLELIWGVGPKLADLLNRLGVYHFSQIASWSDLNLQWVDQNLGAFRGRAVRDKWIEQATKLASGWRPQNSIGDRPES
jgi:NADH-quinone oxidoreductase subunit E